MRPQVDYSTAQRLIAIARDVDDGLEGRNVSFGEALEAVLEYAEDRQEESGDVEPDFQIGNMGKSDRGGFLE